MQPLDERLRACYSELSPQEQRVAEFVMDHFADLVSYNSAELARLSGVSKATVSRLFKRLGYERFKEMRDEVRTQRQSGMPVTDNRDAVQGNTLLSRHYKQEMANLTLWVNSLDAGQFAAAIDALGHARRVLLVGLRNSMPVAMHLRQQLLQSRNDVWLLPQPGQTLSEELSDVSAQDLVIVVAFRRRPRVIRPLLENLHQRQIPVLLISEPQATGIRQLCRWHFACPLDSVSAFDSYSSAMSLSCLMANALLHTGLETGRQRIHQITGLYGELAELE